MLPYLPIFTTIYIYLALFSLGYPYLATFAVKCPELTICAIFTIYHICIVDRTSTHGDIAFQIIGEYKCRN